MDRRERLIAQALEKVRMLAPAPEVSISALDSVRSVLVDLAGQPGLWTEQDFPLPACGEVWQTLSEDPDGRYQLSLWFTNKLISTVPHDHQTWVVVAGIRGTELNKNYVTSEREPDGRPGLRLLSEVAVNAGKGHAMLPDDVHSVVLNGAEEPVMQLHLCGLSVDLVENRRVFDAAGQCSRMDGNAVPSIEGMPTTSDYIRGLQYLRPRI
jgi:predicted metal-dependent enzyme (double-stranded beta helix superfamily)